MLQSKTGQGMGTRLCCNSVLQYTRYLLFYSHTVQMRAKNSYKLYSSWSSAIVLPLDGQCIVQPPSIHPPLSNVSVPIDQEGAMISVFYETDDGNRVRLLDVGCETNPGSSEQNIHSRLEGIEARLVNIHVIVIFSLMILATPKPTCLRRKMKIAFYVVYLEVWLITTISTQEASPCVFPDWKTQAIASLHVYTTTFAN